MGWSDFLPTLSHFRPGPRLSSHGCRTRGPLEASELGRSMSQVQPGGQTSWPGGEAGTLLGKKHVGRLNGQKPRSQLRPGEGPEDSACPQVNRLWNCGRERSPDPHPQTQDHTSDRLPENTRLPVHSRGCPGSHSSKAPLPNEPQAPGCPDQGNQPGQCGTKGRWSGGVKRAQGCCKIEDHDAGEWGAISPRAKATGQIQRRDEPQNEDLDDSGSGM